MNPIEDLDELAICIDISSRMAVYALAKTCGEVEIEQFFGAVKTFLDQEYETTKVAPLIEKYKEAAITLSNARN